jgi:hypothetical protein
MSIHDLHAEEGERYDRGAWYARVSRGASADDQFVYVNIPAWGSDAEVGPCRWHARPSSPTRPQPGDEALVQFDNRGNAWLTSWWPF